MLFLGRRQPGGYETHWLPSRIWLRLRPVSHTISHSKRMFTAARVYKSRSSHSFSSTLPCRLLPRGPLWVISAARITESVAARYGALPATTPMLATVSPFFIEGTAQTYRTTPLDGARASHTVLPNRSVT